MRNYKKIKSLGDYLVLDEPMKVYVPNPSNFPQESQFILRMLLQPKYCNGLYIPSEVNWLSDIIKQISFFDQVFTGIEDNWVYITVRHGDAAEFNDNQWHFDGASFKTETIPERDYIWCSHSPTEYKTGDITLPSDFDPIKHNIFNFVADELRDEPIKTIESKQWYLLNPFCFHRCPRIVKGISRTFIRVSFIDVELRDSNNTQNPFLPTDAYGRDAVKTFRNLLSNYQSNGNNKI